MFFRPYLLMALCYNGIMFCPTAKLPEGRSSSLSLLWESVIE